MKHPNIHHSLSFFIYPNLSIYAISDPSFRRSIGDWAPTTGRRRHREIRQPWQRRLRRRVLVAAAAQQLRGHGVVLRLWRHRAIEIHVLLEGNEVMRCCDTKETWKGKIETLVTFGVYVYIYILYIYLLYICIHTYVYTYICIHIYIYIHYEILWISNVHSYFRVLWLDIRWQMTYLPWCWEMGEKSHLPLVHDTGPLQLLCLTAGKLLVWYSRVQTQWGRYILMEYQTKPQGINQIVIYGLTRF